jgi:glycosyltransferase involved in cell wall biosynthesis
MDRQFGIVVIGRNEGERLARCLESAKTDSGQIIYVDSGSTDNSIIVAADAGARVVRLDITRPFTAARARNEGYSALKALDPEVQFVQFVDGDCILAPRWVRTAIAFIEQRDDVAIVCGRRREIRPEQSIYNWLCDIEWTGPTGEVIACGGDAMVRAEVFEAIGGFREGLIAGEEPELCVRVRQVGKTIWRLDEEMTLHDAAILRFGQFWARAVRGGYAFAEVSCLHRGSNKGIWKKEKARAFFWGGLLPTVIVVGAFFNLAALALVFIYVIQVFRLASSRGLGSKRSWGFAALMIIAKFAEFEGALKFVWRRLAMKKASLIEYK